MAPNRATDHSRKIVFLLFRDYVVTYFNDFKMDSEAFSEPCQTSKMKLFVKTVNSSKPYLFNKIHLRCLIRFFILPWGYHSDFSRRLNSKAMKTVVIKANRF